MSKKLEKLRAEVRDLYTANSLPADTWVDWSYPNHVLVVAELAEKISKKHGADKELTVAGALLHDIADAVMPRKSPDHAEKSLEIAKQLLIKSGFSESQTEFVLDEVIKPHGCNDLLPTTLEGKVMATADGAAHFVTDFYLVFCWRHYGPKDDYATYKEWALVKIDKHFNRKIFFDDIRQELSPKYEALKLLFS